MKNSLIVLSLCSLLFSNCSTTSNKNELEKWKLEIIEVEKNFNDMAQKEGLAIAFQAYAAQDGVIKRGGKIISGNEAITEWYVNDQRPNETLTWKPDFVDVGTSGDLAYTYGSYMLTSNDSLGVKTERTGKFHTVWKRQTDGNWKFVWD